MADFGTCWSCVTDLTMPSVMASGNQCVAEAIARRWQTPRGALIDDPNYGYDLSEFISCDLSKTDLAQIAHFAGSEATKDERVLSCQTTCTMDANGNMTVVGNVTTASGPFQLVVSVTSVTVSLLAVVPQ